MINGTAFGNLGGDAETKTIASGKTLVTFRVASSSGFGDKKTTTWLSCSMWGTSAPKLAPHLTRGKKVIVSGEISEREYEAKGEKRKTLEMNVTNLEFGGDGKGSGDATDKVREVAEEDIPF